MKDGGRPSAVGNWMQAANRLWVLWTKAMVLSAGVTVAMIGLGAERLVVVLKPL